MPTYEQLYKGAKAKTVFTEEDIALVEEKAGKFKMEEIADFFGISTRALFDIRTRQPEVDMAYRMGRMKLHDQVTNVIVKKMLVDECIKALTLFAHTQMGWTAKNSLEIIQTEGTPKVLVQFENDVKEKVVKTTNDTKDIKGTRNKAKKVKE